MLNGISVLKVLRDWIQQNQIQVQDPTNTEQPTNALYTDELLQQITELEQRCLGQYPKKEYIVDHSGRKPVWIEKGVDDSERVLKYWKEEGEKTNE